MNYTSIVKVVYSPPRSIMSCSPGFAEASTIVWDLQLVRDDKFQSIIFEGNSKICVDALNKNLDEARWEIQPLLNDASILTNSFVLDQNTKRMLTLYVVHELSRYVLYSNISYFCKCVSLPLAVMEAWESNVDIPSFCSFNEIFTFIHTHTHTHTHTQSGLQPPIMRGSRKEINLNNGGKGPA